MMVSWKHSVRVFILAVFIDSTLIPCYSHLRSHIPVAPGTGSPLGVFFGVELVHAQYVRVLLRLCTVLVHGTQREPRSLFIWGVPAFLAS